MLVACAGALVAPAPRVAAQAGSESPGTVPPGLGIRLLEAPVDLRDDPRAHIYVIDHVAPGATFSRGIAVTNGTGRSLDAELHTAPATIEDGAFTVAEPGAKGEIAEWATMAPSSATIESGGTAEATLTVTVPTDAEDGEYYGAALAAAPPAPGEGVQVAPRVGIRIYLSVGDGPAPRPDFEISTLTAARREDGTPVVLASVTNTGGRALDMSGDLDLANGPGGTSAGPFPAELGTTLGIGDTEPVTVLLDKDIPNGPWDASLTLRSGKVDKTVTATIEFPEPGEDPKTVDADEVKGKSFWALIALLLLLLALGLLLWFLWRRRKKRTEAEGPS